jgi:hypothetical protein
MQSTKIIHLLINELHYDKKILSAIFNNNFNQ